MCVVVCSLSSVLSWEVDGGCNFDGNFAGGMFSIFGERMETQKGKDSCTGRVYEGRMNRFMNDAIENTTMI